MRAGQDEWSCVVRRREVFRNRVRRRAPLNGPAIPAPVQHEDLLSIQRWSNVGSGHELKGLATMLMQIGNKPDSDFNEFIGVLEDSHKRILYFIRMLYALAESSATEALGSADRDSLERCLRYFRGAARRHKADEEESLFPLVRRYADLKRNALHECLASLVNDHRWAEDLHCEIDAIGNRWLAAGALRLDDRSRLRSLTHSLSHFYAHHIAMEESEVFTAARRMLSDTERRRLGREMADRHGAVRSAYSNNMRQNAIVAPLL
jgi:hemerythrin-like domain-containing protein